MFSKLVQSIKEYIPGEQLGAGYIKLNTNENPHPPSPKVAEVLHAADTGKLRLYPDPECKDLRATLAKLHNISPDNIFVGNGSDEVLAFCFAAFFNRTGGKILFPDITYSFYPVYANFFGMPYKQIPVRKDLSIDFSPYISYLALGSELPLPQGIIIANPNAPTSIGVKREEIERLLNKNDTARPIIIDEAYADFSDVSAVEFVKKYQELCVVRTFSKSYSLAGLRVGYAVARPEIIAALRKIKNCWNSYPVGMLAQIAAKAAAEDTVYHTECVKKIIATRENSSKELRAAGFDVLSSAANFLFITKKGADMKNIYLKLKERKVLVRHFDAPRIRDFIRVTVGTDEEMKVFMKELLEIAGNK
jgi:histidinol-phosphate aminotransferase